VPGCCPGNVVLLVMRIEIELEETGDTVTFDNGAEPEWMPTASGSVHFDSFGCVVQVSQGLVGRPESIIELAKRLREDARSVFKEG